MRWACFLEAPPSRVLRSCPFFRQILILNSPHYTQHLAAAESTPVSCSLKPPIPGRSNPTCCPGSCQSVNKLLSPHTTYTHTHTHCQTIGSISIANTDLLSLALRHLCAQ